MADGLRLILMRHGNTFDPGARVVWAGKNEDFPLVKRGREQAEECAAALRRAALMPDEIFSGPLRRAREMAEIVSRNIAFSKAPRIDERLNEIDYGAWGGLTDEEVINRFGQSALEQWRQYAQWPQAGVWGSTEAAFRAELRSFLAEICRNYKSGALLIVSSNGRLRYFLDLLCEAELGQIPNRAVKTGHLCLLVQEASNWRVVFWNQPPAAIAPEVMLLH